MTRTRIDQVLAVPLRKARPWVSRSRAGLSRLLPVLVGGMALGVLTACGGGGGGGQSSSSSSAPGSPQLQSCANIAPLGDSITLGVNGGYRNNLYTGLQQNACDVSYVGTQHDENTQVVDKRHEGHPGFTISGIAANIDAWSASTQPNIILLMAGTNDIAWWTAESASQIADRHNALISQLQQVRPAAWIFIASIPPQSSAVIQPNNVDRAVLTQQFNDAIRSNVAARVAAGENVRFVDVNAVLTTEDLYDGIHPTEAAHAKIAQIFLEGIRAVLGTP